MRTALESDIPRLGIVYNQALEHALTVGILDWPKPFIPENVRELLGDSALYCFEEKQIEAALRITTDRDPRIWPEGEKQATYLAKIATSDFVRGTGYLATVMLPQIKDFVATNSDLLRLDCLANNPRLKAFYEGLGFIGLGDIAFYSDKQLRELTVTRFELAI